MNNPTEINICCPYLRTMKCGDTKEHRHLRCRNREEFMSNADTTYYCVSDERFILCPFYETIKERSYNES